MEREIRIGGVSGGLGIAFLAMGGPWAALLAAGAGLIVGTRMFPAGEKPWRDIADLLAEGEHGKLEFKRQFANGQKEASPTGVIKTIAAFANTDGGEILIGIGDDGQVLGIETEAGKYGGKDKLEAAIRNAIRDSLNTDSSRLYRLKFETYQDALLCRIEVSRSQDKIFVAQKGEFYTREGNVTRSLSPRDYHEMQKKAE